MKIGDRVKLIDNVSGFSEVRVGDLGTIAKLQETSPRDGFSVELDSGQNYYFYPEELEVVEETGWSNNKVDVDLERRVKSLEAAVRIAGMAFHSYKIQHEAKGTAKGLKRAKMNEALEDTMEQALKYG